MSDTPEPIVIIGGGHAGAALCAQLATAGLGAHTVLVCQEADLPYQRPPLSKSFLKNPEEPVQPHRNEAWFQEQGITVHAGDPAEAIDREAHTVRLRSGITLPYRWLVLATGTAARTLPSLPTSLSNVAVLRNAADAHRLRQQLNEAASVTVLGGGFIGLEVAATARVLGKPVQVLEVAPRLLQRSVSADLAAHVLATHLAAGIDIRVGVALGEPEVTGDRVVALSVDGQRQPIDLLVMGIGAVPDVALAQAAGIACDNGILVDAMMATSDPAILAIGDVANFPGHDGSQRLRLESVQNANDQARTALRTLQGSAEPYRAVPWFWSEQGPMRLQMAGLLPKDATTVRRAGANPASFSLLHYTDDQLRCVESVNAPMDHMAARKLLETGRSPAPDVAADSKVPLKQHL
jgi:3-phenylpropionate/trans-cinnamate dioxygenase ferredoxin reductase subunit